MTHDPLDEALRQLKVPEPSSEAMSRIRQRTSYAFMHAPALQRQAPRIWQKLAWALSGSAVTAVIVFAIVFARIAMKGSHPWVDTIARNGEILHEYEALFPETLKAVVVSDSGPSLLLSDESQSGQRQPVIIQLQGKKRVIRVMTYGGEQVSVPVDDATENLEVLINGDGEIIVAGDDFVWESARPRSPTRFQIRAEMLKVSL